MKNIFICVLHDKVSATKLIAHRAKAQMDKHLAALPSVDGDMPLDYAVIATIYHAATNIIKIISNINCTRLTEDTYDLQDFLEHFITATDRKALVIEANLGQTAGSAVTAVADHIIQRIQPSLLTLIAGKQCKHGKL